MLSPLALALPAMTALQAVVALGVFALSVLAPQLGLSVPQLASLNTLMFAVGTATALFSGRLLARWGDWQVAALCASAIAFGMLCLLAGGALAPWAAVLLFGLAFGPETPASAAVLSRVTPAARRPWIFSVRQTGNQIGAMAGSVLLPLLLVMHPRLPYLAVALLASAMAGWCLLLSRDPRLASGATPAGSEKGSVRAAFRRMATSRPLQMLAFATLCYTAVQVCLNTFLMSLAVAEWRLGIAQAAGWVAWLQAAGLAGRLFWGWLAQRSESAARLLGLLGLMIAATGIALMAGAAGSFGARGALIALLGFSASGWNGVLVAEVSRIAGAREAGAMTGGVLMFGFAGLTVAPLAFAAMSSASSMAATFTLLFGAAGIAGAALLATRAAPSFR